MEIGLVNFCLISAAVKALNRAKFDLYISVHALFVYSSVMETSFKALFRGLKPHISNFTRFQCDLQLEKRACIKKENFGVGILVERLPLIFSSTPTDEKEERLMKLSQSISLMNDCNDSKILNENLEKRNKIREEVKSDLLKTLKSRCNGNNSDRKSMERNPSNSLYMMVKSCSVNSEEWFVPAGLMNKQTSLTSAAFKVARSFFKTRRKFDFFNLNCFLITNSIPVTYVKVHLSPEHPLKPNEEATFFVYKLYTKSTEFLMNEEIVDDYCWLDAKEMQTTISPLIYERISPFLNHLCSSLFVLLVSYLQLRNNLKAFPII